MNDVFWALQDVLRFIAPVASLGIAFLGWKRFPSQGAKLALIGFAVIAGGAIAYAVFDLFWNPVGVFSARDWALILNFGIAIASVGLLIIVLALRRLIASVEAAEADDAIGSSFR